MDIHLIENKLDLLPEDSKREALDFIDFLIAKRKRKAVMQQFDFTWEGGLANLKNMYSSVELQHKSTEWR